MASLIAPRPLLDLFGGEEFKKKNPRLGAILEGVLGGSRDDVLIANPVGMATKMGSGIVSKLVKKFGKTPDPNKAGFVLEDGSLVNLRRDGTIDELVTHKEALGRAAQESGVPIKQSSFSNLQKETGVIRMDHREGSTAIQIAKHPTSRQLKFLRKLSRNGSIAIDGPTKGTVLDFPTAGDLGKAIRKVMSSDKLLRDLPNKTSSAEDLITFFKD